MMMMMTAEEQENVELQIIVMAGRAAVFAVSQGPCILV